MAILRMVFLAGLVLILATAACTRAEKMGPKFANGIAIGPETLEQICGMQWILKDLTLEENAVLLETERPYVQFEPDGKFAGFASVNRFFGSLAFDSKGQLTVSPMGMTMMAGPEPLMAQERNFMKGFEAIQTLEREGIYLMGQDGAGKTVLVFYLPVQ